MTGSTVIYAYNSTYRTNTPSSLEYDLMQNIWMRYFFILMYFIIFVLGVSGNFMVVYVVVRNKSIQNITNIFICNLAFSDILMCLLAVPFTPLSAFLDQWIFGDVLCHLVPMTLGVTVYVSTLTSTAIAIDRYFVIVYPFKPRMKTIVCLLLIAAIWVVSVTISLPLAIYQKVSYDAAEDSYLCYEHWPKNTARQFFTVTSLFLQYIVPCSIITFCYAKVSLVLKKRAKSRAKLGQKSRDREQLEIRRNRRTNKMLIAMVTIFVCCWLPLNIVHVTQEYYNIGSHHLFLLIFFMAHVVAMSSTIYNPFLYAWMNECFRSEFRSIVPCLFRSSATGGHGATGSTSVVTRTACEQPPETTILEANSKCGGVVSASGGVVTAAEGVSNSGGAQTSRHRAESMATVTVFQEEDAEDDDDDDGGAGGMDADCNGLIANLIEGQGRAGTDADSDNGQQTEMSLLNRKAEV